MCFKDDLTIPGEVYKARDTRLERTVAIKILPEHLAGSSEMRERFEREARTVSRLNHPHICRLYDIGSHDGIDFIVMEHLEGETLAERLKKGPLRFEEALRYGREIADALDKAHRQGVVHRDLKPPNIMLTKSGAILLDFGLAKESPTRRSLGEGASDAPTHQKPLTDAGAILGTFQYMAPEQLEGGEIDARTDIFALGAVLYEMLTGKKAFTGKSQASLIGAILKDDPPSIASLQPTTPPELDRLLRKCLAKDPDERWGSSHDVAELLSWIRDSDASKTSSSQGGSRATAWILAGVAGWAVALGAWIWPESPANRVGKPMRFAIDTSSTEQVQLTSRTAAMAISPNGDTMVYVTSPAGVIDPSPFYVRDFETFATRPLPGTEGAHSPFFSPDGAWLGFSLNNELRKIRLQGGAPRTICEAGAFNVRGATWSDDGLIYFNQQGLGIFQVSADGGIPKLVIAPDAGAGVKTFRLPFALPDRNGFLFVAGSASMDSYDEATISVFSPNSGETKVLIEGGSNPHYSPTGHIVYGRDGGLVAVPFDIDRLEVTGVPSPVASGVVTSHAWGISQFDISRNGTLVYLPGVPGDIFPKTLWVDRSGHVETFGLSRDFRELRFSPDGRRIAFRESKGNDDIWTYDVVRGTMTRVTSRWDNAFPVWMPDGNSILYLVLIPGPGLVRKAADGTGIEEVVFESDAFFWPGSVSPDGQNVFGGLEGDIWIVPLTEELEPRVFIESPFAELQPRFSPDGQWLAYVSDESGRQEIYVQPFPGPGSRISISTRGGRNPVWRRDSKELFFLGDNELLSVAIETDPTFRAGTTSVVFERPNIIDYDVMPDGNRFLVIEENLDASPTEIHVVVNWFEELERLVPTN